MSGEGFLSVKTPQHRRGNRPEFGLLLSMVMTAWAIELIDLVLPLELDRFGIIPRELSGLPGILFSPWLHGDWQHLIANTLTFFGLGMIVLMAEGKRFLSTTFVLVLISGLGTWIIGRENSVHIGASGLIYGYFGYILGRAIWEGRLSWIVIGIVVATIYGGMIWGIRPTTFPISWEGHLTGLLAGGWLGKQHAGRRKRR
ncbi:MAG: rhomboid family intramembrane serine protease [Akkermansiaceae bacterium]